MSKICVGDRVVWDKKRLPRPSEAMELLRASVEGDVNPEAAEALSYGIKAIVNGVHFNVFLNGEEDKEKVCTTRKHG